MTISLDAKHATNNRQHPSGAWTHQRIALQNIVDHNKYWANTCIFAHYQGGCPWASCQIRKIAGCACTGNAGNIFTGTRVSDPDMHHGTCMTHVPWCTPGSLIGGFLWSRWRGKRSRHSRHMRNLQFYVSCKRPMDLIMVRKYGWVRIYSWGDSLWISDQSKNWCILTHLKLHLLNTVTCWTPRVYQCVSVCSKVFKNFCVKCAKNMSTLCYSTKWTA